MSYSSTEVPKKAMSRIRELSADEETRRLAFVRERALRDEVSLLNDARREGREEVARNLISMNLLADAQIAAASGLSEPEVKALRNELTH
jgi:hypothetical protein